MRAERTGNVEKQRRAYNQYLHEYEEVIEQTHRRLYPLTIKRWLPLLKGKDILDVGCGNAYLLNRLLNGGILFRSYTGFDISDKMIARNTSKFSFPHVHFFISDAENPVEIPNHSFDVIVSYACLHHLESPEKAICELASKLRVGGRFLGLEVNRHHPADSFVGLYTYALGLDAMRIRQWLKSKFRRSSGFKTDYEANHPGHPGKRTCEEYITILRNSGFENILVESLYLDLLPYQIYAPHPRVFQLMATISHLIIQHTNLHVGAEILIEATKC